MKLEDLKVGSYLWLSDIKNPECADYGPLLVTKITRKTVKFDTNWYGNKPHYINRDEVRVVFTNYSLIGRNLHLLHIFQRDLNAP